jgi:predicted Rossmann fold nucleotide-binding protein DprA/Smf involved in DNA uptake
MTTTTAFTRDSLIDAVDKVAKSLRDLTEEYRSQHLTRDDVRDAIMDICIGLKVTPDRLPDRLQRMLQQAMNQPSDEVHKVDIIVQGLNMSIADVFGPLAETDLDLDTDTEK